MQPQHANPPPVYQQPYTDQSLPNQTVLPPSYQKPDPMTQQYVSAPQPSGPVVTQTTVSSKTDPSGLRTAIPELPIALAIILCIVNFIFPGLGTIIAGFSVLCCGNVGQSGGGRFGTFCINFWVGLVQLFLVFFLIGWIWSIIWGLAFVAIATEASNRKVTTTTTVTTGGVNPQPLPVATETVQTTSYNTYVHTV